jgi:hypothetical protein
MPAEIPENLRFLTDEVRRLREADRSHTFDGGGGGGYDGSMEKRLTTLEAQFAAVLPTLATKTDVGDLKTELIKSTGDIKTEIAKSMGDVRTDVVKTNGETHKWMIGTVIGLFLGFGGLFMAMSNALKPSTPPAATPTPATYSSPPIQQQAPATAVPAPPQVQDAQPAGKH